MRLIWQRITSSVLLLTMGDPSLAEPLRVAAAASIRDALSAIIQDYEATSAQEIRTVYQASSALARQIEAGARIDLFISADDRTMEELAKSALVDADTMRPIASNELVLIVGTGANSIWINSLSDLADDRIKRIALSDPAVPIGHYGHLLLEAKFSGAGALVKKIVKPDHARATLSMVSAGVAQAGFVYRTDALTQPKKVRVVYGIRKPANQSIQYPAAIVSASQQKIAGQKFLNYLTQNKGAQDQLVRHGFLPPAAGE